MLVTIVLMTQVGKKTEPTEPTTVVINMPSPIPESNPNASFAKVSDLEIMFVIDTTASMGNQINELTASISDLIMMLQALSKNLKIGVVEYKDFKCPTPFTLFPLTEIPDTRNSEPRQIADIKHYLSTLKANAPNNTDWEEAVELGIEKAVQQPWLRAESTNNNSLKQMIFVIGDAGPLNPETYNKAISLARSWQNGHESRKLNTVFIPNPPRVNIHPYSYQRDFFIKLADSGGGTYSENYSLMMRDIIEVIINDVAGD